MARPLSAGAGTVALDACKAFAVMGTAEGDGRNEAWTEIARRILEGATGPERCPVNDDDDLVVEREPAGVDGERYTVHCPSCDARIFIDVSDTHGSTT
jgi:hypothetical protein